jgi:hypothetical protein
MYDLLTMIRRSALAVLPAIERFIVYGPDPIDPEEAPGPLETVLPWPVRLLLVAGIWMVARIWYDALAAQQLAWALSYAGAIAVSLMASWWWRLAILNFVLGSAWLGLTFLPPPNRERHPGLWILQHLVEFANRQLSHIEALWLWTAVVLTWKPQVNFQLPGLMALYLLAPSIINGLAVALHGRRLRAAALARRRLDQNPPPDQKKRLEEKIAWADAQALRLSKTGGQLQAARRPLIYLATLLGLAILLLRTGDKQALNLVPLAFAIALGAGLRLARHRQRSKQVSAENPDVKEFRRAQRAFSRRADVGLGPVLVAIGLVALMVMSIQQRAKLDARERAALDGLAPAADACVPERGGPHGTDVQVRMFLLADSQFHELGGERFPGQMTLADALVPVALRPVELDVLSAAPLWRFSQQFKAMPDNQSKSLFWAHLGDLGDLACRGEVVRATEMLAAFPKAHLAGMAPGNHDMSFTGNFYWSPFWKDACPSGRLEKAGSMALVAGFAAAAVEQVGGTMTTVGAGSLRGGALVTVTPLGKVRHRGKDRGLAAIFVDTADGQGFDWGIAGMNGTFSAAQEKRLEALVRDLPARTEKTFPGQGALYRDPAWLVFAHHPVADMTAEAGDRLLRFVAWLDAVAAGRSSPQAPPEPRTLAIVTAHTHRAQTHRHCVGGRVVREIVIGSTIDPPQQAALLEVGPDGRGLLSLRLRTIPDVARAGFTCEGNEAGLKAATCRTIVAGLKADPACESLFEREDGLARDCGELETPTSVRQRVEAVASFRGAFSPAEIRTEQSGRVAKLLACVCRERSPKPGKGSARAASYCQLPSDVFRDEAYYPLVVERLKADDESVEELACLAWAASAVQDHKAAGMTFSEALRCAFDDASMPAAQASTESLEARACH